MAVSMKSFSTLCSHPEDGGSRSVQMLVISTTLYAVTGAWGSVVVKALRY